MEKSGSSHFRCQQTGEEKMKIILRVIVNAVAIGITAWLLPGVQVTNDSITTYLLLGLIFGLVNALVKPIVTLLSCPLVILTLGLFVLVINGLMMLLTATFSGGLLQVAGLGTAMVAGVVMGVTNMVLEAVTGAFAEDDR
jgi:putative membrane protein